MEQNNEQNKIIRVALLSPYLTDNMSERCDEDYVKKQIEKFGYDPKNFNGERKLFTDQHIVLLETGRENIEKECGGRRPELLVIGSTEPAEEFVRERKQTGAIFARYSIFYGGPSEYTGNYPEDSGYALDIPKSVETVRAMITNDGFLDALVAREEAKILKAIDGLNKKIEQPILVTPYLSEALRIK